MVDERVLASAEEETSRITQRAIERGRAPKTYTVIALGKNGDRPFQIVAANSQERADKMAEVGIDLKRDRWAVGYVDDKRALQIAGNNDEARQLVTQHLQHR